MDIVYKYGTSQPLLEKPFDFKPYENNVWVNDFIQLLIKHKGKIKLKEKYSPQTQMSNDIYLMDVINRHIRSKEILRCLNACQLFLQVT